MRGASRGVLRWSGSMECRRRALGSKAGRVGAGDAAFGRDPAHQPRRWPRARARGLDVAPARRASHARHPGGLGAPPFGYYGPCARSWLNGADKVSAYAPKKRGPPPEGERHRWSAERRASRSQGMRHAQAWLFGRLSALRSPRCGEGRIDKTATRRKNSQQDSGRRSVGFSRDADLVRRL